MCSSVDLPEPLRPTRQTRSPAPTPNAAPDSNAFAPKVRLMFCSRSNGGGMSGCPDQRCPPARVSRIKSTAVRLEETGLWELSMSLPEIVITELDPVIHAFAGTDLVGGRRVDGRIEVRP